MTPTPPPTITTARLKMRPWLPTDAPALQEVFMASDAHLRAFVPWVVDGKIPGLTLEERLTQHATAFARGEEWVYGLFAGTEETIVGACGLYPRVGPGALELGYWLAANATGRGYATEAAAELTRIALGLPGIERVELHCDSRNVASTRVAERLGCRLLATVASRYDSLQTVEVWSRSKEGA